MKKTMQRMMIIFQTHGHLVPQPHVRPVWQKADNCHACHRPFGPTLLRHHCRLCGKSYCHAHSSYSHKLPHLGYDPDVAERVCDGCKRRLVEHNLAERVAVSKLSNLHFIRRARTIHSHPYTLSL